MATQQRTVIRIATQSSLDRMPVACILRSARDCIGLIKVHLTLLLSAFFGSLYLPEIRRIKDTPTSFWFCFVFSSFFSEIQSHWIYSCLLVSYRWIFLFLSKKRFEKKNQIDMTLCRSVGQLTSPWID